MTNLKEAHRAQLDALLWSDHLSGLTSATPEALRAALAPVSMPPPTPQPMLSLSSLLWPGRDRRRT